MAIKANKITAENIVEGSQVIDNTGKGLGVDVLAMAAETAKQILAAGGGGIEADEIEATNIVEGFQYIQNPAQPTLDEVRKELAAKVLLAVKDPTVPTEVKTALVNAQTEAQKKPAEPKKLLETFNTLSEALKNVTDAAPNVLKIIKWLPFVYSAVKTLATGTP